MNLSELAQYESTQERKNTLELTKASGTTIQSQLRVLFSIPFKGSNFLIYAFFEQNFSLKF